MTCGKTVDVSGRIDSFQDALGVDLRGKRELNEDAVNIIVAVQIIDHGEHVKSSYRGRGSEKRACKADFFASSDFAFNVELRCWIFAHEDGRETGANAGGGQQADRPGQRDQSRTWCRRGCVQSCAARFP